MELLIVNSLTSKVPLLSDPAFHVHISIMYWFPHSLLSNKLIFSIRVSFRRLRSVCYYIVQLSYLAIIYWTRLIQSFHWANFNTQFSTTANNSGKWFQYKLLTSGLFSFTCWHDISSFCWHKTELDWGNPWTWLQDSSAYFLSIEQYNEIDSERFAYCTVFLTYSLILEQSLY